MTKIEALEAEKFRLRAALERIAAMPADPIHNEAAATVARLALNRKPKAEPEPDPTPEPEPAKEWTPPEVAPEQVTLEIPQ